MSTSRVRPEWDLNHNGARKGLLEQVLARVNGTAAPSLPPVSYSPADLPRANAALNALLQVLRTSSHFDEAVAASLDAALPWLGLSPAESAELRLSVRVGAATRALSTAPADDFAGVTRALEALLGSGAGLGAGVERTKEGMQLTFARSNADTKRRELDQYVAAAAEAENKARQRLEEACAAALALCPPAPTPVPAPGQRPAQQPLSAAKIAAARKMAPVPTGQPPEMDRFPVTQPPAAALPVLASPLHTRSGRRGGVAPQPVPPPPPPAALQGDDEDLPAAPARHTPSPPRVALPAKRARAHAVQYAEGEEEEEKEEEPNKRAAAAAATCEDDEDDAACEVCKQTSFGQGAAAMVLCDGHGCTLGLHLQCFRPPLAHAPEGSWFCRSCEKQRQSGIPSAQLQGLPTATLKQMLAAFIGVPVVSSNAVWLRGRLYLGAQGLLKAVAAAGKGKPPQGRRTRLGLPGAAGQRAQGGRASDGDGEYQPGSEPGSEEEEEEEEVPPGGEDPLQSPFIVPEVEDAQPVSEPESEAPLSDDDDEGGDDEDDDDDEGGVSLKPTKPKGKAKAKAKAKATAQAATKKPASEAHTTPVKGARAFSPASPLAPKVAFAPSFDFPAEDADLDADAGLGPRLRLPLAQHAKAAPSPLRRTASWSKPAGKSPDGRRRQRTLWSEQEVQALLAGVEEHGFGHWAKILKLAEPGVFQPTRVSTDLRDKFLLVRSKEGKAERAEEEDEE